MYFPFFSLRHGGKRPAAQPQTIDSEFPNILQIRARGSRGSGNTGLTIFSSFFFLRLHSFLRPLPFFGFLLAVDGSLALGESKIYDESILNQFSQCGNMRFLKDNISLRTQRFFEIGYDVESQGITIPIRNQFGQLMGVKERFNYDVEDGEIKYFYQSPCLMSNTLYGYSQNYEFLTGGEVLIFEAEKSTMQCHTYGIRNCVSLGSGSISKKQIQILLELNPKKVIFMHDVGYKMEYIIRNIDFLKGYSRFSELQIGYWDYFDKEYTDKVSPSDMGKEKLEYILNNEIKMIGDDDDEEL